MVKIKYFTLPNNLTAEPLVPEFLQGLATPQALAGAVSDLMHDPQRRKAITDQFSILRTALAQGADKRAAQAVFELAGGKN